MSDAAGRGRSVTGRAVREATETAARWLDGSRVRHTLAGLAVRFETAVETSVLGRASATVGAWVRGSWWYRWLTAEPDPDVIVIDLRETYTVGPVVHLLDRVADPLADAWHSSSAADTVGAVEDAPLRALSLVVLVATFVNLVLTVALGSLGRGELGFRLILLALAVLLLREDRSAAELAETRAGRHLRAVFEPPPVPEERGDEARDEASEREQRGE